MELKLIRDKGSQAMTGRMFADRIIPPPFPTLPTPSTQSPRAIASGYHGNKLFPSQPLSSGLTCHTSKRTRFLSVQAYA